MAKSKRLVLASLSALLTPTVVFWLLNFKLFVALFTSPYQPNVSSIFLMSAASVFVSLGHVFLLGLPAFFLLRKYDMVRWWSMTAAGAGLGAAPSAFFLWPRYSPGSGSVEGDVVMVSNGVPTHAWWMGYLGSVTGMAFIGATTALVFWFAYTRRGVGTIDATLKPDLGGGRA
ncbi:MAG: hypothetical protein V4857_12740 [Pseudomonadota bacterium]